MTCLLAMAGNAIGQDGSIDKLLKTACPARDAHSLSADETAILLTVARHYKKLEWTSERARREGTFIHVTEARHAVPSLASPLVILLDTLPYHPSFDAASRVELQRHGVSPNLADVLSSRLRSRNSTVRTLDRPKSKELVALPCRELVGMAFAGLSPPAGDFANASRAISISLPAIDDAGKSALVLSVNSIEYRLEGKTEDLELTLLRAEKPGAWQIEWHADIHDYLQREVSTTTAATAEDYAAFDAVLSHLDRTHFKDQGCTAVVNQTRSDPGHASRALGTKELLAASSAAAGDREKRGSSPVYIGTYSPKRGAKLVQREALLIGTRETPHGCRGAIRFSLPGYASSSTAVIVYTLQTVASAGVETGEGWALLTRTGDVWRVVDQTYQRWLLVPR